MLITVMCAHTFIKLSGPTPQQWQEPDRTLGTFFPFLVLCGLHNLLSVLQQQFFPVVKSNSCHHSNHSGLQKKLSVRQSLQKKIVPWTGWHKAVGLGSILWPEFDPWSTSWTILSNAIHVFWGHTCSIVLSRKEEMPGLERFLFWVGYLGLG